MPPLQLIDHEWTCSRSFYKFYEVYCCIFGLDVFPCQKWMNPRHIDLLLLIFPWLIIYSPPNECPIQTNFGKVQNLWHPADQSWEFICWSAHHDNGWGDMCYYSGNIYMEMCVCVCWLGLQGRGAVCWTSRLSNPPARAPPPLDTWLLNLKDLWSHTLVPRDFHPPDVFPL